MFRGNNKVEVEADGVAVKVLLGELVALGEGLTMVPDGDAEMEVTGPKNPKSLESESISSSSRNSGVVIGSAVVSGSVIGSISNEEGVTEGEGDTEGDTPPADGDTEEAGSGV